MDNSWIENGDLDNPGKLIDVIIKKNKKIWFLEGVVVRQKEALERLRKKLTSLIISVADRDEEIESMQQALEE